MVGVCSCFSLRKLNAQKEPNANFHSGWNKKAKSAVINSLLDFHNLLALRKDISQHCVNQASYITTSSLDRKDDLFTDYLVLIQFRWSNLK